MNIKICQVFWKSHCNLPLLLLLSCFSHVQLCARCQPTRLTRPWDSPGRTLEWVAISFSNAWKWKVKVLSRVWLLATPGTAAYQAPPSMGFARQECWSGLPLPPPKALQRSAAIREMWVQSLSWENPPEKDATSHSSNLAWEIPWTKEPVGLHRVSKSQTWLSD